MTLQEKRIYWMRQIEKHTKMLNTSKENYKALMSATQPTMQELYNGIEKYFDLKIGEEDCEYFVRVDARGMPLTEIRKGNVARIKIKDEFYLDEEQKEAVRDYVTKVHKLDFYEINIK